MTNKKANKCKYERDLLNERVLSPLFRHPHSCHTALLVLTYSTHFFSEGTYINKSFVKSKADQQKKKLQKQLET